MAEFQIQTHSDAEIDIIELTGYLDAHTTPQLENAFTGLIEQNRFKVIVDFHNLKYISSAGLGVFMAFIENMRENSGDIKFAAMQPNVFEIFDLLGFPMLYEIFQTVEEAIQKFKNQ
jgi:anti-sigma B factor antagonist